VREQRVGVIAEVVGERGSQGFAWEATEFDQYGDAVRVETAFDAFVREMAKEGGFTGAGLAMDDEAGMVLDGLESGDAAAFSLIAGEVLFEEDFGVDGGDVDGPAHLEGFDLALEAEAGFYGLAGGLD